jgi:hypothetical protein
VKTVALPEEWELYCLSSDPFETNNLASPTMQSISEFAQLQSLLSSTRSFVTRTRKSSPGLPSCDKTPLGNNFSSDRSLRKVSNRHQVAARVACRYSISCHYGHLHRIWYFFANNVLTAGCDASAPLAVADFCSRALKPR